MAGSWSTNIWKPASREFTPPGMSSGVRLLAHLAFAEGGPLPRMRSGFESRLNYDAVPSCVYTNPEVVWWE